MPVSTGIFSNQTRLHQQGQPYSMTQQNYFFDQHHSAKTPHEAGAGKYRNRHTCLSHSVINQQVLAHAKRQQPLGKSSAYIHQGGNGYLPQMQTRYLQKQSFFSFFSKRNDALKTNFMQNSIFWDRLGINPIPSIIQNNNTIHNN